MKKILAILLAVVLIAPMVIPAYAEGVSVPSVDGLTSHQQGRAIDSPFYGRLCIPDVSIDVALYYSIEQDVTDREDSANIFTWQSYPGEVICDHGSQEFSSLFGVAVGTTAYIEVDNEKTIHIKCVDVFDGYNTRTGGIVDTEYNTAHGLSPYMMYTCTDSAGETVRIWLWETYEPNRKPPAFAATPKLNIKVPQISKIQFNTKLEDAVAHAAAEAVKNIDFSKIDFSEFKFDFGG